MTLTGQTIRGYDIGERIGSGGYGEVYRATQLSVDRDVAIKVILPQYTNDPAFRANFEAEVKLVAALEHPFIVPLIDYWQDDDGAFLVMRYIRGGSLRGMLAKQGALPLARTVRLIEQIADALNAAHEAGVVHRDLKPDNILIDQRGSAYLTDFGIAKQTGDENASATDAIKGTFAYLSPEQIQQTDVSPRTDIYALGVVLYEMLAGQHPFHETPVGMMVMKHLQEPLPDIREARDDLSDEINAVIQRATDKDPADRYPSTLDLVADLKAAVAGTTPALSAPATTPPPKKKPTTTAERNRDAMLTNVRKFWVEGVLENSLHDAAMIDLGVKPESGAVDNPWDTLIRTPSGEESLTDERIIDVFDRLNGKLLILGDPGSGKTTTLLALARDLLRRAEADDAHSIPVVLNLSSWSENQSPLTEWLVEELNTKYQVPRKVGTRWVDDEELLLLLDGLDEVAADVRDACVEAINTYRSEHGFVDVVVCSRIKDYEALSGQLKLNGAIVIQPLNDTQIIDYLDALGPDVAVVRELIERDAQLHELAQSPLMLSIMVLAYRGQSGEDVPDFNSVDAHREHLFSVYVERMYNRRTGESGYTRDDTRRYITWLAGRMQQHALSVFHIEGLQPNWLPPDVFKHWEWYPRLTLAGIFGLTALLTYAGFAPVVGFPVWGALLYGLAHLAWGLVYTDHNHAKSIAAHSIFGFVYFLAWTISYRSLGTTGVVLALLVTVAQVLNSWISADAFIERGNDPNIIQPIDQVSFSIRAFFRVGSAAVTPGLFGVAYVLAYGVFDGHSFASWSTAIVVVLAVVGMGLMGGINSAITASERAQRTQPNQGIIDTAHNSPRLMLVVFVIPLFGFLAPALMFVTSFPRAVGMVLIYSLPMFWGILNVFFGGYPVLQHILLRGLLRRDNAVPSNIAHFLDYAASLVLMRKVGGGYIFIHRYLLEYFAALEPTPPE